MSNAWWWSVVSPELSLENHASPGEGRVELRAVTFPLSLFAQSSFSLFAGLKVSRMVADMGMASYTILGPPLKLCFSNISVFIYF